MSWKKYGGIKQLTQSNYVNVNSVVTNTLTLREHYDGNFQINGSLFVNPEEGATNSSVNGNLDVSGNLLVTGNVTLEGDIRPNNIYVNNILDVSGVSTLRDKVFLDSSESTFLSGSLGKIGVNRLEADYLWDVCANHTQVARFVSQTDSAQHVIIQNKHHYGIVSEVDNSANRLLFYHQDVSMTEGEFGGDFGGGFGGVASIQYTPDGIMTHDVSQSIVLQTQQVIVGVDGVDGVGATLTVYDSLVDGSSVYLSHVDLSNTTTTSTALQLVSHNNSSNTFLKMVTPQNKGWNYGGGLYPFDTSRSMGSLGWTDICGSHYVFSDSRYIPSQTMVAGNNVSFLRSTTGFNTFQPETDRYTVNINGPLKLQHQEIHEVANMPFVLRQIAMSKYDGYGLAVGEKYESDGDSSYFYYFLSTYDYGRTWSSMDVTSTNDITFDAVVADSSFALIYGEEQNTFYSVGSSGILNYSGSSGSDTDVKVSKRFLFRYNNSNRMFVFENSESFSVDGLNNGNHYYSNVTLEGNSITVVQQVNEGEEEGESNDLSYNAIYSIDGASNEDNAVAVDGNFVFYMAGQYGTNGTIYQVLHNVNGVSGESLLYTSSSVDTGYVSIKSFGDNLVAVGGTYVTTGLGSGASFSDYELQAGLGVGAFTLNDVFLLDASHAIVVGTNATLFYSRNYMQQEWSIITIDMIDGMGNGHVLLDSQNDLLSVHMIDANTFLFGCKIGSTGESKILSCHFPDLFYPETAPSVLDICGNVTFGGSLYGSSEVQLFSTSSVVHLGATDSSVNMGVVNAQEILLQNEECLQLSTITPSDTYKDSGGTDVSLNKRIVLGDANTRIDIVGYLNLLDLSATNIEGGTGTGSSTDSSGSDISGSLDVDAVNDLIDSRLTTFYDVSISTIERTSSKYFYVNYDASYSDIQTAGAGLYIYNDISSDNFSGQSGLEDGYIRISKYKVAGESKQDSFSFLATGCDSYHGVRLNVTKIADNTTKLNESLPTGSSRKPLMFTNYKNNDGNNAPTDADYLAITGDFEDDRAEIVVDQNYPYMDECGNLFTNGHHLYTVDLSLSGMLYGMDASFVGSVYMDTDLSINGTGDIGTLVVRNKTTIGGSLHGADASFNGNVFIGMGVGTDTPKLAVEHLEISGGSVGRSVSLLYTDANRGHQMSLGTDVVDFSNSVLFVGGIQDCGIVMGVSGDRPYIAATKDKSGVDASGLYLSNGPYDFSDNTTGMVVGKDSVQVNTGLSALSFSALSDYRLKHNVKEIELRDLDKMDLLRPVSYSMRGADERQYGFIAHELQTHYPDLVLGEKDAHSMQQINYIGLIPLLVREIQDLRTKVAELSSRIG